MSYERFAQDISKKYLHNHEQSERLLKDLFLQHLSRALATPFPITFRGFGTFKRVKLPPRRYYDINTGTYKTRPTKKTVLFLPSKQLLKKL